MKIEKRIQRLEDIEAIKQLKSAYLYHGDELINGNAADDNAFVNLLTDDICVNFVGGERVEGKEAAYAVLTAATDQFAAHMITNPIVEVDGDTAKGKWYLYVLFEGTKTGWLQGVYTDEFVRINGEWKIKYVKVTMTADATEGGPTLWGVTRLPGRGGSKSGT